MATAVQKTSQPNLESLQAGDRLLKAVKERMRAKGEKIDESKLRKEGYSEATIARLREL